MLRRCNTVTCSRIWGNTFAFMRFRLKTWIPEKAEWEQLVWSSACWWSNECVESSKLFIVIYNGNMGTLMNGLRSSRSWCSSGSGHALVVTAYYHLNITGIIFSRQGHSHAAGPRHRLRLSADFTGHSTSGDTQIHLWKEFRSLPVLCMQCYKCEVPHHNQCQVIQR